MVKFREFFRIKKKKKPSMLTTGKEAIGHIDCPKCNARIDITSAKKYWEWFAPLHKGGDSEVERIAVIVGAFHCMRCPKKFLKALGGYVYDDGLIRNTWGKAAMYEKEDFTTAGNKILSLTEWR